MPPVHCASIRDEDSAYSAMAIALTSEILGSEVTARTYARHGHLDPGAAGE